MASHSVFVRLRWRHLGFFALNAGLAASVFHLGRPLGAWRFFLGLRTSWMSREILAFGLFAGAAFAAGALCWILPGSPLALAGVAATGAMGLIAVFTSVMIYVDTRRAYWSLPLTAARFYGATILLGVTAAATGMGAMEFLGVGNLASAFGFAVLFSIPSPHAVFWMGNLERACGRCAIARMAVTAPSRQSVFCCPG